MIMRAFLHLAAEHPVAEPGIKHDQRDRTDAPTSTNNWLARGAAACQMVMSGGTTIGKKLMPRPAKHSAKMPDKIQNAERKVPRAPCRWRTRAARGRRAPCRTA